MKAAVLKRPGELVIEETPIPEPEPGWVRVRNMAAGVCGSDMHIYTGNHPWLAPGNPMEKFVLGNVYGHEVAGTVDKLGEGVTGFNIGDRVSLDALVPCMKCAYCRVGLYQICAHLEHYGFHYPGGFAEYMLVPVTNACRLPDNVSFEEGALLDVLVVGIHAVQLAHISIADRVAVLGAGPIGIGMAAVIKRAGVRQSFITAKHPRQRELAKAIGIDHVLDPNKDVVDEVLKLTDGLGVDCVLESIGYKSKTIEQGVALIRRQGRIVFTGVFEEPVTLNFGDLLGKEATITASHAFGMWNLVPELQLAVEMVSKGMFPAKQLITHRFPLEKINEAFNVKLSEPDKAMKVMITF